MGKEKGISEFCLGGKKNTTKGQRSAFGGRFFVIAEWEMGF